MTSESELEEMAVSFAFGDDDYGFGEGFDDDLDDFGDYEEDDQALDEFDDAGELSYDDYFKEEEEPDEPFDDAEAEDGYTSYSSSTDDIFRDDEF